MSQLEFGFKPIQFKIEVLEKLEEGKGGNNIKTYLIYCGVLYILQVLKSNKL